jgi:GTP cyclohydrolase I
LCSIVPLGTAVIVKGIHYCMKMRGVKQPDSSMITSFMSGVFKENLDTREEFFHNVRLSRLIN